MAEEDFKVLDVRGWSPEAIYQRILSEDMWEGLTLDPKHVRDLFISNIVMRTYSRVVGQGPYNPVPIKCNEDGYLYVAGLGGGYTRNETKSGTAADAYGAAVAFSEAMGRIDLIIFDNPAVFKRTRDNVVWDDEIELFADAFYSFDATTLQFNIKNKTAGLNARYQVVGWYT